MLERAPNLLRSGSLEPLTFYLELEPGTKADLEVVARASLAFASAVREIAFVLDPSLSMRVELVSGTEGSLSLNSLLRFFGKEDATARQNVKIIALSMVGFFTVQTIEFGYQQFLSYLTAQGGQTELSRAQINEMAEKAAEAVARRVGAPQGQKGLPRTANRPCCKGRDCRARLAGRP